MKTTRKGKSPASAGRGGLRGERRSAAPTASPGQEAWRLECIDPPDLDKLVIDDGAPVDNIYSEKQMRLLTEPLYSSWSGPEPGREFLALADVGLFYSDTRPPLVPDVILSLDISQSGDLTLKENRSYFVWRRGKVPEVVIEIVSNREGGEDTDKLRAYARQNIPYYVIFDPCKLLGPHVLRVFALVQLHYEPIAPGWLEDIGLGLTLWEGRFEGSKQLWLRWCDRTGKLIPTGAENALRQRARARQAQKGKVEAEKGKAEAEKGKAEAEKGKAEAEKGKAEADRARAKVERDNERLRAKLRAAGIDPDTNGR